MVRTNPPVIRVNPPSEKIEGGYYIKARKIQNSVIAHAPPHVREIWDWLIKEANYKPHKVGTKIIERGQVLTTYQEIQEGLSWQIGYRKMTYKGHQCETAMKLLVKHKMVTTERTTRGMIITICKYELYQSTNNYENHNGAEARTTTVDVMKPHGKGIKGNKEINKESVLPFSTPEFNKIWDNWMKYRRSERWTTKETYLKTSTRDLKRLAGDNVEVAIKIIQQSMDKGWQGLFSVKGDNAFQTKPNRINHGTRKKGKYETDPELKTIKM